MDETIISMVKCPYCRADIDAEALKCRHCSEWVKEKPASMLTSTSAHQDSPMIQRVTNNTGDPAKGESLPEFSRFFGRTIAILNLIYPIVSWSQMSSSPSGVEAFSAFIASPLVILFSILLWLATVNPVTWPFTFQLFCSVIATLGSLVTIFIVNDKGGAIFVFLISGVQALLAMKALKEVDAYLETTRPLVISAIKQSNADRKAKIQEGYSPCPKCGSPVNNESVKCWSCDSWIRKI